MQQAAPPPVAPESSELANILQAGVGAIANADIVTGGFAAAAGLGVVVEEFFGEGEQAGHVARAGGIQLAAGFVAAEVTEQALKAIGIEDEGIIEAAEGIAAAAALAPPLVPVVATIHALGAVLNWIGGPLDDIVDSITGALDPFNGDGIVGGLIAGVGGFVSGLFGGGGEEPVPPELIAALVTAEEAAARDEYGIRLLVEERVEALQRGATRLAVIVSADQYSDELPRFAVEVDGKRMTRIRVFRPTQTEWEVRVNRGEWQTEYFFPARQWEKAAIIWENDAFGGPGQDRNLIVGAFIDGGTQLDIAAAEYHVSGAVLPGEAVMRWPGRLVFTSEYGRRMEHLRAQEAMRERLRNERVAAELLAEEERRQAQQQTPQRQSGGRPFELP